MYKSRPVLIDGVIPSYKLNGMTPVLIDGVIPSYKLNGNPRLKFMNETNHSTLISYKKNSFPCK